VCSDYQKEADMKPASNVRKRIQTFSVMAILLLVLVDASPASATSGTLMIDTDTTLTEDHSGSIVINADDITLDCDEYSVTGLGSGEGILLNGRTGVTVKNCHVTGFTEGFVLTGSSGNTLKRNTASDNSLIGFALFESSWNNLVHNIATGNQEGFGLTASAENILKGNRANHNVFDGFLLQNSTDNILKANRASDNAVGFSLESSSAGNTLRGNTADGNGVGFEDGSTGSGTAGTANTYNGNKCKDNTTAGSFPSGLCMPQP